MCRAIVYAGAPIELDVLLYRSPQALVRQAYAPQQTEVLNLAGTGVVAWDPSSHVPNAPFVYRTPGLAAYDRNLKALALKIHASCALAHVRGTPLSPEANFGDANLHPFHHGQSPWYMAHNGDLAGFARMRQDLMQHLRGEHAAHVQGTTDSEVVYALVNSHLHDGDSRGHSHALVDAVTRALRILRQVRRAHGIDTTSSLNLFFTNDHDIVALRYVFDFGRYPDEDGPLPESSLRYLSCWATVGERFTGTGSDFRMTGAPESTASVLVASEPLSGNRRDWVEVPEYAFIIARRTATGFEVRTQPVDV
jgi:predicted glutamine amidotransferase